MKRRDQANLNAAYFDELIEEITVLAWSENLTE